MATFDDRDLVEKIIQGNGWAVDQEDYQAPDNPPVVSIVEYTSAIDGATLWGVVFAIEEEPHASRYKRGDGAVTNPRLIWEGPAICPRCREAHPPNQCIAS